MVKLKALMNHIYANKRIKVGDLYDATDGDAKVLLIMDRAIKAEEEMAANEVSSDAPPSRGKRYRRRDMRAEA